MKRLICVLLISILLLSSLSSCIGVKNDAEGTGGVRAENGSWDAVDFGGQEVKVCISTNHWIESYFPAGDIYTRGPDTAGSNEVSKEVLSRNKRAAEDLGVTIVYAERDLTNTQIQEDIRATVQTAAKNSPDVYVNDLYGLARAMVDGLLWNVKAPGDSVNSYFDFEADGWNLDYMKGCTFDQEKYYLFAGDYFIDMVRMAWAVYVNHDLFNASLGAMPAYCQSLNDFYGYVEDGFWDLDMLETISSAAFSDSGILGKAEKTDERLGLYFREWGWRLVSAASRVTLYYQDENFTPEVLDDIDLYQRVANKYVNLISSKGTLYEEVRESPINVAPFLWGNVLFCFSPIGELESQELRSFSAEKGLVPLPKWNSNEQEDYFTPVHDQAEIGCILNTAKAFSAASALMQYLNEESEGVVYAYYEKGLKYKYNDDKNARKMMDIISDTTDSPFSWQIGVLCETLYTGTTPLVGVSLIKNTTVSSTFASEKDAYEECMRRMLAKFSSLN